MLSLSSKLVAQAAVRFYPKGFTIVPLGNGIGVYRTTPSGVQLWIMVDRKFITYKVRIPISFSYNWDILVICFKIRGGGIVDVPSILWTDLFNLIKYFYNISLFFVIFPEIKSWTNWVFWLCTMKKGRTAVP